MPPPLILYHEKIAVGHIWARDFRKRLDTTDNLYQNMSRNIRGEMTTQLVQVLEERQEQQGMAQEAFAE